MSLVCTRRGVRGRDHLVKILVLQSPDDDDAYNTGCGEGMAAEDVAAEDGSMVDGAGKVLVEELAQHLGSIPEVMLLTGGRPGVEMFFGQVWVRCCCCCCCCCGCGGGMLPTCLCVRPPPPPPPPPGLGVAIEA